MGREEGKTEKMDGRKEKKGWEKHRPINSWLWVMALSHHKKLFT